MFEDLFKEEDNDFLKEYFEKAMEEANQEDEECTSNCGGCTPSVCDSCDKSNCY